MRFLMCIIMALALAGCGGGWVRAAPPQGSATPIGRVATRPYEELPPTATATPTASATVTPTATVTITPTATAPAVLLRLDPPIQHALVVHYQQRLLQLGYAEVGAVSGRYDAQTEAAVQHFEWLNGLAVDGAIDAATAARLEDPGALAFRLPPPFAGRILRRGMYIHALEGPLLARLTALGYLQAGRAVAQGKFTGEDEDALRAFQRANHLPASGVLDLASWEQAFSPRARMANGQPANGGPLEETPAGSYPPGWRSAIVPLADVYGGAAPLLMTAVNGQVWLARADGALLGFDTVTGQLHGPIFLGDLNMQDSPTQPLGLAAIGHMLWVYSVEPGGQVLQGFDTRSGLARPPLLLADCPSAGCTDSGRPPVRAFGFDGRRIWIAVPGPALRAINPLNGSTILQRALSSAPAGPVAFDGQCLWVGLQNGETSVVDPGLGTCLVTAQVVAGAAGSNTSGLLAASRMAGQGGRVWLSAAGSGRVEQFDAANGQALMELDFSSTVTALRFTGGQLWVGEATGRLTPLDALNATPGQGGQPGCVPLEMIADGPRLWVACADQTLRRVEP